MATLALYLPETWVLAVDHAAEDAAVRWYLLGSTGRVQRRGAGLPALTTTLDGGVERVVAILPGECATLLKAALPIGQRRRLLAAIPFIVEDELASAVEDNHFALGGVTAAGDYPVVVIDKALLRRLLARLGEAGLTPAMVCVDSLLVPAAADELTLLDMAGRVLLSLGGKQAVVVARDDLAIALASALDAGAVSRVRVLLGGEIDDREVDDRQLDGGKTAAFWQSALAASGVDTVALEACSDPVAMLLAQLDQPGVVNLLSGEFKPAGRHGRQRSLGVVAVAAALVIVVLQLGYFAVAGWYFNRVAEDQRKQAEAIYRDIFPGEQNIINLRVQAEGHLKAAAGGQGRHLIAQLQAFGPVWRSVATPASVIHSLRYDGRDNTLNIDLSADSVQRVEQLAAALRVASLSAQLLSAQGEGAGVRARLMVGDSDD
ncbi:MAG: type II secretion system protein GspL [Porticoccaceae bacterium]